MRMRTFNGPQLGSGGNGVYPTWYKEKFGYWGILLPEAGWGKERIINYVEGMKGKRDWRGLHFCRV